MRKVISLVMGIMMLGTNFNALAMDRDPVGSDDYDKIRSYFKKEYESNPDPNLAIEFQLKRPTSAGSDYREVKVYNMQHLCRIRRAGTNFLQTMIDLFIEAQDHVHKACLEHDTYKGPELAMDKAIMLASDKIRTDVKEKEKISMLAKQTGLSYDEALWSYLIFIGTEAASKAYSSKYSWKLPVGSVGAVGGMCLGLFSATKVLLGLQGAANVCLGIGGILSGVALVGISTYIANDYVQKQAKNADVMFRVQRMQNVARALKQFGDQIVGEPESVLESNVFITAIDLRKNKDGTDFESNNRFWRWWYSDLRNDKAWCAFDYITNLACAPRAKEYTTPDGRSLSTIVNVFSRLLNAERIDYGKLREYLENPIRFERSLGAVVPSVDTKKEESTSDDQSLRIESVEAEKD